MKSTELLEEQSHAGADTPAADGCLRRKRRQRTISALAVLVGIVILLYPVVSTVWNNWMTTRAADDYSRYIDDVDDSEIREQLENARRYNAQLTASPIHDPWTYQAEDMDHAAQDYYAQLALTDVMARLRVPSIDVDLPVYHGTSDRVLGKGVGHLYGTDLPVGGEGTHSALTAHTGLHNATLFDSLDELRVGQSVFVEVYGEVLHYKVTGTQVVLPEDVSSLAREPGKDLLTLITCTPYGVNSHRLLVHAERAPYDPSVPIDGTGFRLPGELWMWLFGAAAALAAAGLVWMMHRNSSGVEPTQSGESPDVGARRSNETQGNGK